MSWVTAHPRTTWGLVGLLGAIGMLGIAFSVVFVPLFFIAILLPFVLWKHIGGRTVFTALITLGIPVCIALAYAYATSLGCPSSGALVELKKGKRPVGCAEIRANYLIFSVVFGIAAGIGFAGPSLARSWDAAAAEADDDEDEADGV